MFDWIRNKLKIDSVYECERCGEIDYPVIVNGVKFCNHCSGAANPKNHEAYMERLDRERKEESVRMSVRTEAPTTMPEIQPKDAQEKLRRLLQISYMGMYSPGNESIDDAEIQRLINELGNFFIKYQLPNNIQIATDSINILKTTVNFDTFFSRVDVCHNAIRGWWGEDIFFGEVDKQKVRLLVDSLERLKGDVSKLKRVSSRESRVIDYIGVLQKYREKLATCVEYEKVLQNAKGLLSQDTLQSVENNTYTNKAKRGSSIQLDGYTQEETIFIDALKRQAGKHARYLVFYKESNGGICVFHRKPGQGQLNVGVVKLQGRAKYIKINDYRIDGELDVLLPHVDKFIEKIDKNEATLKEIDRMGIDIMGRDMWNTLNKYRDDD